MKDSNITPDQNSAQQPLGTIINEHPPLEEIRARSMWLIRSPSGTTVLPEPTLDRAEQEIREGARGGKPANPNASSELVAAIMAMPPRYSAMKSALCDYVLSDEPLAVIAKRHGYTGPAIAYWIWKLCLPARGRGRPILQQPTSAHRRMLALARAHGVAETARRVGVSRQRVDQVIDRWAPELKGHLKPPVSREHHRFQQQPARTVLVSFRLSKKEWSRLATSEVNAAGPGLSPYEKAREIVLQFIATPGDGSHETAANLLNPPAPTLSHTIVNVDIQKAA